MKVQFMSDLHLEFGNMIIPEVTGDILVLAGDIGVGVSAVDWINEAAIGYEAVIYVPGNHEFYHHDMPSLIEKLKTPGLFADNVHFMNNETITINGVKFAVSTLWADMSTRAFYNMNDSKLIRNVDHKLTLVEVKSIFKANKEFLLDNRNADVIVTHHCPNLRSININRYSNASMNSGYYTDILSEFVNSKHLGGESSNIKHWICGHTHSATEYTEYGINVHNNCRGYVGYGSGPQGCEVTQFNPGEYFEV